MQPEVISGGGIVVRLTVSESLGVYLALDQHRKPCRSVERGVPGTVLEGLYAELPDIGVCP
jgi:hypothetical protein